MKQQVLYQKVNTLRLTVYNANRALVPSSALITLYLSNGSSILQSQASATVDSTTGEMTYSLTTNHTANLGLNYKAVWQYIVSGVTYYETQLFDVVRSILSIPITDDDLYAELPSLRKSNVQDSGIAVSATASTLVDTKKRKETNDYWKGGVIETLSGTGLGQTRDITGFTQSTGTITVSPDWTTTPDATTTYRIVKSWTTAIETGFDKIEQMLYNKGKRDALILEASQIKIPLVYLVIHTICVDLMTETDDKWDLLQKLYQDKFEKAFNNLTLDYDEDESGGVEGQEIQMAVNTFRIQRS